MFSFGFLQYFNVKASYEIFSNCNILYSHNLLKIKILQKKTDGKTQIIFLPLSWINSL